MPQYPVLADRTMQRFAEPDASGNLPVTSRGPNGVNLTPNVFKNVNAVVITSETTVWTPTSGKKFRLMGYCLTQGVATGNVTLKDNTAGTTILIIPANTVGVSSGMVTLGEGILSAAANNVLTATGVSTETISGYFFGIEQ